MKNYEKAQELLAALDSGVTAPRPKPIQKTPPGQGICSRCNQPVRWANTVTGSRMPLDRHPEGHLVVRDGVAIEVPPNEGEPRFIPHFKSCRERATQ